MKLPLFYGKFPHFPHYFPHFPYIIGYARLAKLLYRALLFGCKLNIILNGKWTSFRWCGWHLKSDLMQDVRAWGWRAAIKPESDAGHRSLRLAGNDKISHKGHRTALRCCRCPFYIATHLSYMAHRQITKNARPPMKMNLHGERAFCVFVRFEWIYSACGYRLNP